MASCNCYLTCANYTSYNIHVQYMSIKSHHHSVQYLLGTCVVSFPRYGSSTVVIGYLSTEDYSSETAITVLRVLTVKLR